VVDSHIRGVVERLAIKLRSSFHTTGIVKQNTELNNIISTMKSEIKNLSKQQ